MKNVWKLFEVEAEILWVKYQMYLQIVRSLLWNFEVTNHVLSYLTAAILQHNLIANLQFQRQGPKYWQLLQISMERLGM